MADREYGARRNGAPFINAQPRFGIYRDWRAEIQTIYWEEIYVLQDSVDSSRICSLRRLCSSGVRATTYGWQRTHQITIPTRVHRIR